MEDKHVFEDSLSEAKASSISVASDGDRERKLKMKEVDGDANPEDLRSSSRLVLDLKLSNEGLVGESNLELSLFSPKPSATQVINNNNDNINEEEAFDNNIHNKKRLEEDRTFSCNYCKREFHSPQALGGHQNAHRYERSVVNQCKGIFDQHRARFAVHIPYPLPYTRFPSLGIQQDSMISKSDPYPGTWLAQQTIMSHPPPYIHERDVNQLARPGYPPMSVWGLSGEGKENNPSILSTLGRNSSSLGRNEGNYKYHLGGTMPFQGFGSRSGEFISNFGDFGVLPPTEPPSNIRINQAAEGEETLKSSSDHTNAIGGLDLSLRL
ncbi:hypothetical protein UlMin_008765 [Ulmus minor]